MPCSPSPFNVFLQVQKTDQPCTGWSSCLNLRLWHHALVTSTIPTLIEKKKLCVDVEVGICIYVAAILDTNCKQLKRVRICKGTLSISFVHFFCRLATLTSDQHHLHDLCSSNLLIINKILSFWVQSLCSHFGWVSSTHLSPCGWKFHVVESFILVLYFCCKSACLLFPSLH